MISHPNQVLFRNHALAVFVSSALSSIFIACVPLFLSLPSGFLLLFLPVETYSPASSSFVRESITYQSSMIPAYFFMLFITLFPISFVVFSAFWPVTRKRGKLTIIICALAGAIIGMMASSAVAKSAIAMAFNVMLGAASGALYMLLVLHFWERSIKPASDQKDEERKNLDIDDDNQLTLEI
jgi:hypothetical protein